MIKNLLPIIEHAELEINLQCQVLFSGITVYWSYCDPIDYWSYSVSIDKEKVFCLPLSIVLYLEKSHSGILVLSMYTGGFTSKNKKDVIKHRDVWFGLYNSERR